MIYHFKIKKDFKQKKKCRMAINLKENHNLESILSI